MMTPAVDMPVALRRVLIGLFVAGVLATLYFGLIGTYASPLSLSFVSGDRLLHVLAFTYLGLFAFLLWGPLVEVALALILAAGAIELLQFLVQWHQPAWLDFAASASGVVLGGLIYGFVSGCWLVARLLP